MKPLCAPAGSEKPIEADNISSLHSSLVQGLFFSLLQRGGRTVENHDVADSHDRVAGGSVCQLRGNIRNIERYTNTRIQRARVPTEAEVEEARDNVFLGKIRARLQAGQFENESLIERLLEEGFLSTDIAAACLSLLQSGEGSAKPNVEQYERPSGSSIPNAATFAKIAGDATRIAACDSSGTNVLSNRNDLEIARRVRQRLSPGRRLLRLLGPRRRKHSRTKRFWRR